MVEKYYIVLEAIFFIVEINWSFRVSYTDYLNKIISRFTL